MSQEELHRELRRQVQEDGPPARPPVRVVLVDVLVIVGVFAVAGVLAGVVWPHLVAPVTVTRTDFGLLTGETALSNRFATDGSFTVLGAGIGLVLGGLLTWWRHTDEVVTVIAVAVGAALASLIAASLGHQLGPEDPTSVLRHAKVGATALEVVKVTTKGAYFVWPVMALVGALVVLWGRPTRSAAAAPTGVVQ